MFICHVSISFKLAWTASEEEISDLQVWDDKWDCEVEIDDQFTQYLR